MLTSLALIFLVGLLLGKLFQSLKLPQLIGMILTGVLLGPHLLGLIDKTILGISPDLRQLALIIILTRAGLSLDLKDLKKIGRPAILMCFVPACFEILGTLLLAPRLLHITYLEAAIMGSVIAAVSPAVIVPRMIRALEQGYGSEKRIPQLILAGASADDVFVIIIFTALISLAKGEKIDAMGFAEIPISILLGILMGFLVGGALIWFFKKVHIRDTVKLVIMLSISFLLIELQNQLDSIVPMSGLLAIMSMGIMIFSKYDELAKRLSIKYNKLWIGAEIILFVLVGATLDLSYVIKAGVLVVILVFVALVFRMIGVLTCLIKTNLNSKEKLFCVFSYMPKATVQAAIGAIPLSMGLECGNIVLTVAVLSILITAPLGAFLVDHSYQKLLAK